MTLSNPPSEEKKASGDSHHAPDGASSHPTGHKGWSAWFGGPNTVVGPRIGPVITNVGSDSDSEDSSSAILQKQIALEAGCAIQYRTCSWQKVRYAASLHKLD